mmetsp:Transcript_1491/g.3227  ORF Transcript_1491/g.3227 Transcript_1491/m.3227 type:complete len:85 (-) Transcript_1491:409-663(-)
MSTAIGSESLNFFARSGALAFGIVYGAIRTRALNRKEARIEAREEALAKKKAERAAKRAAKVKLQQPEAKQEDDFWGDLLKESK